MNANHALSQKRHLLFALKLGAGMVGAALLLSFARKQGWIDQAVVVRGFNVIMGLAFAAYGNVMPKFGQGARPRTLREASLAQAVGRVTGWTMTLTFLAWAALWAFAPQKFAMIGSLSVVGASALVMLGFALWKFASCRASQGK